MANIPMKDIQFPGLDDTYTFAQIDNTLTQTGQAADAKKTGDEITALKADLTQTKDALVNYNFWFYGTINEGKAIYQGDGSLINNSDYNTTDFIPVSQGDIIYGYGARYAFYDNTKTFLSGKTMVLNTGGTPLSNGMHYVEAPENAAYFRISAQKSAATNQFYVAKVYGYDSALSGKIDAINSGSNIWDLVKVNVNKAITPYGNVENNSDYDATDFYAIPNGCVIYGFGSRYAFYDNTKTLITGATGILNTGGTPLTNGMHYIVAPENAVYFRICASKVLSTNQKITYVSSVFDRCLLDAINNPVNTRKLYCLGDSITRGMYAEIGTSASSGPTSLNYPYWIGVLNRYDVVNYGNSGSGWANKGSAETVADTSVNRNAKDVVDTESFDDADIITLAFGVNDWKGAAQDIVLGDMTSVSGDGTVIGNMKYCIETLADPINGKAKQAQIIVLLPLNTNRQWSGMDTMTLANNWAFGYAYRNNQTLEDYRTAIKTCAEYYNVKVIDLEEVCPINRLNIRQVLGDGLHPTKAFHKQMGQALAPYIH